MTVDRSLVSDCKVSEPHAAGGRIATLTFQHYGRPIFLVMSVPSIAELRSTWERYGNDSAISTSRTGINLLANGHPVTAAMLADASGISFDDATAFIDNAARAGVEVEDGAVIGAALTLRPTQHRFRVRGTDLYTWCGFDAMFLPIMLNEWAHVRSTCPATGAEIHLTVAPDGAVTSADPPTVVVGVVGEEVLACCSAPGPDSEICRQMPLLTSRTAGEHWVADHPGVAIVDMHTAREIAHAYVAAAAT